MNSNIIHEIIADPKFKYDCFYFSNMGSVVKKKKKNLLANAGDTVPDPWIGKISWRKKWQPLHYPCLEIPMD